MIKLKTLAEVLLSAFIVRLLVKGACVGDALVVMSLCGIIGYEMFLRKLEVVDPSVELKARLAVVEEKSKQFESKFAAQMISGRRG